MTNHFQANTFTPERVSDRLAIQDLIHRWCRAVDRLDFDAMRDIFHPDAIDDHNRYSGDIPGLLNWIEERHRTITFSMHMVGNMVIEFASPELALSESYVWFIQRYPPEAKESLSELTNGAVGKEGTGMDMMGCSRYVDRVEKRDGQWRIAKRTAVSDWKAVQPFDSGGPAPLPHWNIGRRDKDDPLYRERAAVGLAP